MSAKIIISERFDGVNFSVLQYSSVNGTRYSVGQSDSKRVFLCPNLAAAYEQLAALIAKHAWVSRKISEGGQGTATVRETSKIERSLGWPKG